MRRREVITLLGGAAAWPFAARAQQSALPVVAFINGSADDPAQEAAFRKGLAEAGAVEGQNVRVEFHWLAGQYDRVSMLVSEFVRRRVAVIATPGFQPAASAAKAATATIPIVFGVTEDPVKLGLVANFARPGGNATGINFFIAEIAGKRLGLLHELVPRAARIALLLNPANVESAADTLKEVETAAGTLGLETKVFKASTSAEIDAAFADFAQERFQALFVFGDGFFVSRRVQLATLAVRDRIPASFSVSEYSAAGGLMSYGPSLSDMFRQAGVYAGAIVKGAKPADLPVVQSSKFEFVINLQTAKSLGLAVPPMLLAIADEVIE
jgi:putative tryptophan/tyrosine transport system substrate-binding protein